MILPKELEDIIIDYISQLEHVEKMEVICNRINDIDIEYSPGIYSYNFEELNIEINQMERIYTSYPLHIINNSIADEINYYIHEEYSQKLIDGILNIEDINLFDSDEDNYFFFLNKNLEFVNEEYFICENCEFYILSELMDSHQCMEILYGE